MKSKLQTLNELITGMKLHKPFTNKPILITEKEDNEKYENVELWLSGGPPSNRVNAFSNGT